MTIFTNPIDAAAENADGYITAVLALVGDREPLEILEALGAAVEERLRHLSDEDLRRPEQPGKWSIIEVVQHLADSELVWGNRLRSVIAEPGAPLTGYDQDAWAKSLRYRDASLSEALEQIRVLRSINLRLLRDLKPEEWQRHGVHNERGKETIEHMVRLYAGHDLVHLAQIDRLLGSTDH